VNDTELYTYGSDRPIISSLLWTDEYKLTMGQLVWRKYRDVLVKYGLTNRTKEIRLPMIVDEGRLREELNHVRSLKLTKPERRNLELLKRKDGKPLFCQGYLDFLENIKLPPYELSVVNGEYRLEFPGKWSEAIYWEIPALTIINTLANEARFKQMGGLVAWRKSRNFGDEQLTTKIEILNNKIYIRFIEFGTRRADSPSWQDHVVDRLVSELKHNQLIGTSNVYLGLKYGIPISGTIAHEMFMIMSGIMHASDETIRASHNQVLDDWEEEYGLSKAIILPDTYGSDFCFSTVGEDRLRRWDGFRQDSGEPIEFGEKEINLYKKWSIDPRTKLLVPSDGLDIDLMIKIAEHFLGRIQCSFGWGTNLTNDVGLKALSIVIKAIMSCGFDCGKLSDNLAKAIGQPEVVERLKRIFGHTVTESKECRY